MTIQQVFQEITCNFEHYLD